MNARASSSTSASAFASLVMDMIVRNPVTGSAKKTTRGNVRLMIVSISLVPLGLVPVEQLVQCGEFLRVRTLCGGGLDQRLHPALHVPIGPLDEREDLREPSHRDRPASGSSAGPP